MKCVVINGTEIRGCTYNLKEIFLEELQPEEVIEYYLLEDAPPYCIGCKTCFLDSEEKCPHVDKVKPIWHSMLEADLIVFAYPVYALRAPGQIKSLLDHIAVHWFIHRPDKRMFSKTAAIITQSIGAPNGAAQKDVKTSLEWLGVPVIKSLGFGMMEGIIWDEISQKRKDKFKSKMISFAKKFKSLKSKNMSVKGKLYFTVAKKLQENALKKLPEGSQPQKDVQYWIDQGWIGAEDKKLD